MSTPPAPERGHFKSPKELAAGLFLIALALIGYFGSLNLAFGKLSTIGPGLMPQTMALLVGALGLLLVVEALTTLGDRLDAWSLRGMLFVLGAVCVFAATVRTCGLLVAGPAAIVISSLADRDTKPREIAIFAFVLTSLSGIMFKDILNLPVPFDPLGLVPQPVASLYSGFKASLGQTALALLKIFR